VAVGHAKEMEGEFHINRLNALMSRLVSEKQKLQDCYSFEVREK